MPNLKYTSHNYTWHLLEMHTMQSDKIWLKSEMHTIQSDNHTSNCPLTFSTKGKISPSEPRTVVASMAMTSSTSPSDGSIDGPACSSCGFILCRNQNGTSQNTTALAATFLCCHLHFLVVESKPKPKSKTPLGSKFAVFLKPFLMKRDCRMLGIKNAQLYELIAWKLAGG